MKLENGETARIINVASLAYMYVLGKMNFDKLTTAAGSDLKSQTFAYGISKLANILFTKQLAFTWDMLLAVWD